MNTSLIAAAGLRIAAVFSVLLTLGVSVPAQHIAVSAPGGVKQAPPAPPAEVRENPVGISPPEYKGTTLYSIGTPTDEEQLYLEYINRSRANPVAEAQRFAATTDPDVLSAYGFYDVDLGLMQYQFSTNPPVGPLAMNARLLTAARLHSGDMFTNVFQGHVSSMGLNLANRVSAQGYSWSAIAENVFSYAESVFHGHAGFDVDWGNSPYPGGMQTPPGHRNNIHSATYREVGIGVVNGRNTSGLEEVGPQLVTQDFGTEASSVAFITGVVFYDVNTNGFYDAGEGIGGVRVDSAGSRYYCMTPTSGGYALPVTSNGNYVVTFDAPGLSRVVSTNVTSLRNIKVDFAPPYTPPVLSGPNPAYLDQDNAYSFTPLAGATAYDWERTELAAYTAIEGAENGLANVTVVNSPGYSVLASLPVASGSYSFHLAHLEPEDQFLTLNAIVRPSATSQLSFAQNLAWATDAEIARAQVTTDGGASWQNLWSQAGNNGPGQSSFTTVT
ncbi:MAG: hypothetical protein EHM35_12070, partial [Planctomycetaceae bacterium]